MVWLLGGMETCDLFFAMITFNKLPTSNWRGVLDKDFIKESYGFWKGRTRSKTTYLHPLYLWCPQPRCHTRLQATLRCPQVLWSHGLSYGNFANLQAPLCYGKVSQARIFSMPSWPSKVSKNEKLWKANIYESPLNHLELSTSLRQSNIIMRWFHRVIPEIRCKTFCKSIITIMSIHSSHSNCCLNLIGLKAISI